MDANDKEGGDILTELRFQKVFKVEGYSPLSIPIKYIPKQIRQWNTFIELFFENFMHSPPIRVELTGRCVELPISVEKKVYDMEICLMDNTYREELVFINSGANPMKVQVVIPKETKQFIQLNPSFGYIQAYARLNVWLKLTITNEFANMCQKYKRGDGEYMIPIQLICSEQRLPVNFDLRVRVTSNKLLIDPKLIDFGLMYQDTAKKIELDFENTSDLPQEIYFYPLPKTVTYEPAQIPITIMPSEIFKISFIYRAYEVRKEEDYIVIQFYPESKNRYRKHRCKPVETAIQSLSDQVSFKVLNFESGLPHTSDRGEKYPFVCCEELLSQDLHLRILSSTLRNLWTEDLSNGLQVGQGQVS
jgi:hypothetical protein